MLSGRLNRLAYQVDAARGEGQLPERSWDIINTILDLALEAARLEQLVGKRRKAPAKGRGATVIDLGEARRARAHQ